MPTDQSLIIILIELWLLGGLVLMMHRLSTRLGLGPLLVLLGSLTAVLQFNILGSVLVQIEGHSLSIPIVSVLTLPSLFIGLLVVYIINGTVQARFAFLGMLLVTACIAIYQLLPAISTSTNVLVPTTVNLRMMLSSAVTLMADLVVLIVVYQFTSNMTGHFPSRLASMFALLAALWIDALLFPSLYYLGLPQLSTRLWVHLLGKTLAALLLAPMLVFYLKRVAPSFPETAATSPRPAMDLFTTTLQLEARARYQHSLLHIMSQINQLMVRSINAESLLQEACRLLVDNRDCEMAWIGIVDESKTTLHLVAHAGVDGSIQQDLLAQVQSGAFSNILHHSRPLIHQDLVKNNDLQDLCCTMVAKEGYRSLGIFPLRHANVVYGLLILVAKQSNFFVKEEVELLQELANDLAYALTNLESRKQQALLQISAENMQDGLLIVDLDGKIIYANPAAALVLQQRPETLPGLNLLDLTTGEKRRNELKTYLHMLLEKRGYSSEFINPFGERPLFVKLQAFLIHDPSGRPTKIVISVQDITLRRQYEHQLLTLNRFVNELVQIHNLDDLMPALLLAAEQLLQSDASALYLFAPNNTEVIQTLCHGLSTDFTTRLANDYDGLPGETVAKTGQPVFIEDVLHHPVYGDRIHFMAELGIKALLLLPVLFQKNVLGCLVVYYHQPRRLQEEEIQMGLTLTHTLAIAIQNARLYQSEHSQRELAEALVQAAAGLNSSLNLDEVLDGILEQTLRVANCRSVNILLVEKDEAYLARRKGYDNLTYLLRSLDELRISLTTPTLQRMISSQQPLLLSDVEEDPLWTNIPGTETIKSFASAPLLFDGKVVGFLNVDSDQAGFFTEETTHRLQAFAAHAAIAIQNARLYRRLQQYAIELEDRVQERTAELQAAKEYIEGILASVPDAVFVLNSQNELLQANQAGESLLASVQEEGLDLFTSDSLTRLLLGRTPSEKTILEVKGRAYQPLASNLSLEQQPAGKVLVFRDVTRFQELDKMKTRFVSDVSHELRTPLTNMTIYLDLLTSIDDPQKRQNFLETLRRETGRLTHLIEDLLTISRLEAGRMDLYIKPIEVNKLIFDLVKDRSFMGNSKGLCLECDPAENLPPAMADTRLLTQAISNLLTNAINYTPPGGKVSVKTRLVECEGMQWITLDVSDTGAGISSEEAAHIFERFYRGSASYLSKTTGTGLGLPISKDIVEGMGGHITMQSTPNRGSTFTVWLRAML